MSEAGRSANARAGIDALFLPTAFTTEAVAALSDWRQGDLVRNLRLFWGAPAAHDDPITGLAAPGTPDGLWAPMGWTEGVESPASAGTGDQAEHWGIITSQTCDVVGAGPGAKHPTVQVASLIRLDGRFDKGQIMQIKSGRSAQVNLVYVPNVPEEGDWAADLRISLPVSKAVLLEQTRVPGFSAPADALAFAEKVATKVRRPALHDELSEGLVSSLRETTKKALDAGEGWPEQIEQFRLILTKGERLDPQNVELLVVLLDEKPSAADKVPLRAWRKREKRRLSRATGSRISLAPVRFVRLKDLDVQVYRDAVPLHVPELGRGAFFCVNSGRKLTPWLRSKTDPLGRC